MSVKIERDTYRQATKAGPRDSSISDTAEALVQKVGTTITGGKEGAAKGYLASYIKQLESNPLRTKILTAGTLAGLQEIIASWLAKDISKHGHYVTPRVPKMAAYGALVSAPLGHVMIWLLQKVFAGRKSLKAKILQILASNLIVRAFLTRVWAIETLT